MLKVENTFCSVDVYSFLHSSSYASSEQSSPNDTSISEIVEKSGANNSQGQGILRGVYAAKVCCVLSQKADELFHAAALRLSLPGLCSFITELCKSSHTQVRFKKMFFQAIFVLCTFYINLANHI